MMAVSSGPIVVVGSGPSGLFQALYLADKGTNEVVLVEAQPSIGGMFQGVSTPLGIMDSGVFLLEEIGDEKFDALIFDALAAEDWNVLTGVRKDIAGNYFKGKLNTGSLFPDLRLLDNEDYVHSLGSLLSAVDVSPLEMNDAENLQEYFSGRFGDYLTDVVLRPIAEKIWNNSLEKLSPWAAKVVHLSRFVVADHEASFDLKQSRLLDAILGFPDQLSVPPDYLAEYSKSFYPRNGLAHLVEGIEDKLNKLGVRILTSTKIEKLNIRDGNVDSISMRNGEDCEELSVAALLWTSASNTLLPLLNLSSSPPPDIPIPHRSIYLFLSEPPLTEELYWFWSYDDENKIVRVSTPSSYSPMVEEAGIYALCVETHVESNSIDDADLLEQVERELRSANIVGKDTVIVDHWVNPSVKGYFVPTIENCRCVAASVAAVNSNRPENLYLSSQNISTGDFYLRDILKKSIGILEHITTGKAS